MIPKNGQMLDRAKELRKNMTPQERKLWYDFLRSYPIKIYKQRIIERLTAYKKSLIYESVTGKKEV